MPELTAGCYSGRPCGYKLGSAVTAHFAGHQTGEHHRDRRSQCGEKTQPNQRGAEQRERHSGNERSERRVNDVSPAKETSVIDSRQLVAVKSVLAVRYCVQREYGQSTENEDARISRDHPLANAGKSHRPFFLPVNVCSLHQLRRKQEALSALLRYHTAVGRQSGQNRSRRRNWAIRYQQAYPQSCKFTENSRYIRPDGHVFISRVGPELSAICKLPVGYVRVARNLTKTFWASRLELQEGLLQGPAKSTFVAVHRSAACHSSAARWRCYARFE